MDHCELVYQATQDVKNDHKMASQENLKMHNPSPLGLEQNCRGLSGRASARFQRARMRTRIDFLHSYLGRVRGHNSIQNSRGGGLFILSQHYDLANTRQGWLLKSNLTNVGIYFHRKKDLKNTYIHNYKLMKSLLIIVQKFRKIVAQIVSLLYIPPPPQGLGCCLVNKGELKNTSK